MRQYLLDKGLVAAGEPFSVHYLPGGVSCETVRVRTGAKEFVIKQALPKLRVKEDWFSDIRRIFTEKDCLSVYYRLVPKSTPELYFATKRITCSAWKPRPSRPRCGRNNCCAGP